MPVNLQNYLFFMLLVLVAAITTVQRTMVRRIHKADQRALSTFTLPTIIRKEYKQLFGADPLYWISRLFPIFFLVLVLIASVLSAVKS